MKVLAWVMLVLAACVHSPTTPTSPSTLRAHTADHLLMTGDDAGALRGYTDAWEHGEATGDVAYNAAVACSHLKRIDEGIRWLTRAIEHGAWGVPLTADPDLAALRADPRFAHLVADATARAQANNVKLGVGAGLPRSTPDAEGIDREALDRLVHAAQDSDSSALVILHDGKVIGEWYFGGYSYRIEAMSAVKSMTAVAIGLLVGDGKIKSLDEPVWHFYPQWRQGRKEQITIRMLLSQTSGLAARRTTQEVYRSPNFVELALAADLADDPGTFWFYNNEAVNLLVGIVERASGIKMDKLLERRVFAPLGIRDVTWSHDDAGNPHGMAGMQIHPIDFAKIGQMMLDGGTWKGVRILDPAFIAEATRPSQTLNPSYGLLWWILYDQTTYEVPAKLETALREKGFGQKVIEAYRELYGKTVSREQLRDAVKDIKDEDHVRIEEALHAAKVAIQVHGTGPYGYEAAGSFGQFLVVLPAQRLVAMRMVDSTHTERTDRLGDFGALVRALVK